MSEKQRKGFFFSDEKNQTTDGYLNLFNAQLISWSIKCAKRVLQKTGQKLSYPLETLD